MAEKLKSWLRNDQYFYSLLVIVVGLTSFFLGQSSVSTMADTAAVTYLPGAATIASVAEEKDEQVSVAPPTAMESIVVASQSGTKYHLPECPGALQIKPENKISFPSAAAAAAAGYSPAANCPGLK